MKYDKIVAMNQAKSKQKADIAIKQIEKMLERKERISVTALAQNTGFAKSFFYRNPEVRKALDDAQLQQGECYNPKKVIFDREHKQQFDFLCLTEVKTLYIMPFQAFRHLIYNTPQQI